MWSLVSASFASDDENGGWARLAAVLLEAFATEDHNEPPAFLQSCVLFACVVQRRCESLMFSVETHSSLCRAARPLRRTPTFD